MIITGRDLIVITYIYVKRPKYPVIGKLHFCMALQIISILFEWALICTTLRPRQNGRHFADDVFKCIS